MNGEVKKGNVSKMNIIERFFYGVFSTWLYKLRYPVIIIFIGWLGWKISLAIDLQAPKEATQAAPEGSII